MKMFYFIVLLLCFGFQIKAQENQTQTQLKLKQLIEKKAEYHKLTGGETDATVLKFILGLIEKLQN